MKEQRRTGTGPHGRGDGPGGGTGDKCPPGVGTKAKTKTIPGGKGRKLTAKDVAASELRMGIAVEMEHVVGSKLSASAKKAWATEITLDHLAEDPEYYTNLKKVHKESVVSVNDRTRFTLNEGLGLISEGFLADEVMLWINEDEATKAQSITERALVEYRDTPSLRIELDVLEELLVYIKDNSEVDIPALVDVLARQSVGIYEPLGSSDIDKATKRLADRVASKDEGVTERVFIFPDRHLLPIDTLALAESALALVGGALSGKAQPPSLQTRVRNAVFARYPDLKPTVAPKK